MAYAGYLNAIELCCAGTKSQKARLKNSLKLVHLRENHSLVRAISHFGISHWGICHPIISDWAICHRVIWHWAICYSAISHVIICHRAICHQVICPPVIFNCVILHYGVCHRIISHQASCTVTNRQLSPNLAKDAFAFCSWAQNFFFSNEVSRNLIWNKSSFFSWRTFRHKIGWKVEVLCQDQFRNLICFETFSRKKQKCPNVKSPKLK